ncbi:MAG: GH32 C-terminal domain-containing protein [Bacilli bacterium]|nr:GH32 C-terminal domain-containing protein [Bacilli bacterium]
MANNIHKPIFHITGEKGWINDPNGVVKFKNQYHVFYQYHPYSCEWGPMHWGHVVSDDLKTFKYLPNALTPGDEFDKDGCFSGSSLVKDGVLYVAYTGFINNENPEDVRQIQCLASSKDGIHFKKHGAIITGDDLPSDYKKCDFRDPKLIFKDGFYYIFAVTRKVSGGGSIVLFKSKYLKKWEFVNDVLTHNSEGKMLECIDYHEDLNLILYSEQDFPSESEHCLNIHSCEYEIGKLDDKYKFIPNCEKTLLDYGFDFYAAQIMDEDHILFAWMNMWGRNNPSSKYGFAGMLTVPRKVEVVDNMLLQTPIIYGELKEKAPVKDKYSTCMSVGVIKLEVKDLKSLDVKLRKGDDEETRFYLKDDTFYFDRSKSGEKITGDEKDEYSLNGMRKMPYLKKDKTTIYFVLDKYSVEIFVNGITMSNVIYPKENSDIFELNISSNESNITIYK